MSEVGPHDTLHLEWDNTYMSEKQTYVGDLFSMANGYLDQIIETGFLRVLESWNCFGISFSLFKGLEKL